ncbi:hypothetical protein [Gorillibacterium sp. sgz500922]|uniref:hypothetical protein n=1 Tax=Gorillibacterium sp. sgz500922 TaxID=3446694 RepID=UPI003F668E1A
MKISLTEEELQSAEASWLCVKPFLLQVRGKSQSVKNEMYRSLSPGQKALFLFYSYHNHTDTLEGFFWFTGYHVLELKAWDGIRTGLRFLGESALADDLDELEHWIKRLPRKSDEPGVADLKALADERVRLEAEERYRRYQELAASAIKRMNEWVREHRQEWIGP